MESKRLQRDETKSEPVVRDAHKMSAPVAAVSRRPLTLSVAHSPALHLGHKFGSSHTPLPHALQARLTVNEPGDQYEQEADRVADRVMRMSDTTLRLQCNGGSGGAPASGASGDECAAQSMPIMRSVTAANTRSVAAPSVVHQVLRSPGQALDQSTRAFFESRMGHDFSGVRVHTNLEAAGSASAVAARAYTVNSNIVFGEGEYAPQTESGRRLLSHELVHVIQQQDSVDPEVQRTIRLGGVDLDAAGVSNLANDLVTNRLRAIVPAVVNQALIRETIREMQAASTVLDFADADAVASNVRHRVLLSHYMRASQGSTRLLKAFSYPDRASDGTSGVGPKVNDDATAYWGAVQDAYYFDLSPAGLLNPYQALIKLFTEQTNPHKRTLIHCDYVISLLQFRAYAENIGIPRFNALVATGALSVPGEPSMRLKWNGFEELVRRPAVTMGLVVIPMAPTAPLQRVTVSSRDDLVVGDHVVFYNHASYDALIQQVGGIWRLENAIVIDRVGGQLRYQGHGYFSPVTEDVLLAGMIRQYNRHIDEARAIVHRIDHGSASQRASAEADRLARYSNVRRKLGGGWEVSGSGLCGTPVTRDLTHLTPAEAPGLIHPCGGGISVSRPVERIP